MKKCWFLLGFFLISTIAQAQRQPDLGTEQQRQAGKQIYDKKCAQCHGINGDGNGVAAPFFKPVPRDFTRGVYKIRTTESGALPTDADLKRIIRKGMPYTGMPAWPDLSDNELTNLVYYLKTFAPDFADPDYLPTPIDLPKPPKFSMESAQKGRAVFEANDCIACHGNYGRGDGPSATSIVDDWGNHIRPADMTKRWTFRGGGTREDIYRTFTTGINGTPMPSYKGLISPEDQWHLVDYVYSLSRDEPDYGTIVISKPYLDGELDLSQGRALFAGADSTYFPIVGQVIEPGRAFFPSVNGISVRAVHNADEIAIMLNWNDMSAEESGHNAPNLPVEEETAKEAEETDPFAEEVVFDPFAEEEATETFSDAVAIQFPSKMPVGQVKPYLLFGDRRNAVDLWFVDLAKKQAEVYIGKGSDNVTLDSEYPLEAIASFADGEWTVIYKRKRQLEDRLPFDEDTFIPVAFTVWDGFNQERGNKRGLSSWYYLYVEPLESKSVVLPVLQWGFLTLMAELFIVVAVRRRYKNRA